MGYLESIEAYKGDSIDIEVNHKRLDITGYSIRATIWDSNIYAYQRLGLSINSGDQTSSSAQTYKLKINGNEYSITTEENSTYAEIVDLLNLSFDGDYISEFIGFGDEQDIKIRSTTKGSTETILITAGSSDDLLTLLSSIPTDQHSGTPHIINKGTSNVTNGSDNQIYLTDTRAGYQSFGLSIDSSSGTGSLAQDYDITVNDTLYTITLTSDESYASVVSKLNTELGSTFTCEVTGSSPTQDIRIIHNTEGDDNDVEVSAGSSQDLLTFLGASLETAISGFTNKGWFYVYINDDETLYFVGDCFVEIEVTDTSNRSFSYKGYIRLKDSSLTWSNV